MADPPRPEVAAAVEECRRAGIRIIMITGGLRPDRGKHRTAHRNHPGGGGARIITGLDLEQITGEQLKEALRGEVVFARVAPEQKLQVVTALQEMGHIARLRRRRERLPGAEKSGHRHRHGLDRTDVAKEAADMILTDDNFALSSARWRRGARVYNNIRRFATYILNSNMPEAVPFIAYLFSRGRFRCP
jgi:magnesium-transporting ATPase (P-type)